MSEIRWSDNDKIKEKDKMRSYRVHDIAVTATDVLLFSRSIQTGD